MHLRPLEAAWRRRVGAVVIAAVVLGAPALVATPAPASPSPSGSEARTTTERHRLVPLAAPRGGARSTSSTAHLDADAAAAIGSPERARVTDTSDRFVLLGVTVDQPPDEPVLVRTRSGGAWSPWYELVFTADEGPDTSAEPGRPGAHSQPVWVGGSDAYEVDASADIEAVDVHLVSEHQAGAASSDGLTASAAGSPSVLSRAAWGARPPAVTPTIASGLKVGIVHHSVTGNSYTSAEVPSVLRSIQAYHMDAQGWNDIAYNFAVDRFGRTWEARAGGIDKIVVGGHSAGFNTGSVGVVVLGDFGSSSAPAGSVEAVANLLSWKFALHHVYPSSTVPFTTVTGSSKYPAGTTVTLPRVIGHRDVQSTSCPGTQLYGRLPSIRSRVAQLWAGHRVRTLGRDTVGVWSANDVVRTNSSDGSGAVDERTFGSPGDRILVGDWDGDGVDTLGVRRGNLFVVTNRLDAAGPYTSVTYGLETDTPLVGDWDGNGTDTIGIRRGNAYHLRNSMTPGGAQITYSYGKASDVPVFGDWDGNITETPGIRRGNAYYLRNSNSSGNAQLTFGYGTATDVPVTGDWDGNGTDTPGVRRGTTFLLRDSNTSGNAQRTFSFGPTGGSLLAGDWNGS